MPSFRFSIKILSIALAYSTASAGYTVKYDSNSDGVADLITSVSDEYEVSFEIKAGIAKRLFFKRDTKKKITWAHYQLTGNKYALVYQYSTKDREFHNEINCNTRSPIEEDFFDICDVANTAIASNAKFDRTCSLQATEKIKASIGKISRSRETSFGDCLKVFQPEYARKWTKISSVVDGINFSCSDKTAPKGKFDKDLGSITISNTCLNQAQELQKTLEEELLHAIGIGEDRVISCAQKHCPSRESFADCAGIKIEEGAVGYRVVGLLAAGSETFQNNKDSGNLNVPKEIAVEQAPQLSIADLRVQGPETVSTTPSLYDRSMLTLAKNVFGGSEAQASPPANSPRLANNTAPVPAKSTAPAAFLTRTPASAGADGSSAKSVTAITAKQATGSENPNSIAVAANQKANSAELGAAKAGSSTIAATGANALTANSGGSRGPASTGSTNGNAESLGKPGTLKLAGLPQKELVQVLDKNAYYIDYRSNLKDPNFIATLKRNSITIIDAKGNVYGAPQGNFRYADTGQRLIKNSQTNR